MATKQFRVNLSEQDANHLKKIADNLGISASEVIRKGLRLMSVYAQTNPIESNASLILKDGEKEKHIIVI